MVDTWKYISHVSVYSPFGTLIYSACVPICTNKIDASYYPVWKVVQKLKNIFDCSLFTYVVRISTLSTSEVNHFSSTRSVSMTYSDALPMFSLYE